MNLDVALGCMRTISNIGKEGFLDGIGISRGDFDRCVGEATWMSVDRNRMTTTLGNLMHAGVDALGLPRFNLPAEWIAGAVSMFVHPTNTMAACTFMSVQGTAKDMAAGAGIMPCSVEQLFSIVCLLNSNESRDGIRQQFEKKTKLALEKVAPTIAPKK